MLRPNCPALTGGETPPHWSSGPGSGRAKTFPGVRGIDTWKATVEDARTLHSSESDMSPLSTRPFPTSASPFPEKSTPPTLPKPPSARQSPASDEPGTRPLASLTVSNSLLSIKVKEHLFTFTADRALKIIYCNNHEVIFFCHSVWKELKKKPSDIITTDPSPFLSFVPLCVPHAALALQDENWRQPPGPFRWQRSTAGAPGHCPPRSHALSLSSFYLLYSMIIHFSKQK